MSGLEVVPPPRGDPFTPYFVCLERFNGCEHKIVAYPAATNEGEAIRLAEAECQTGRAAYAEEGRKLVEKVLRKHCAWEAHNHLRNFRLIEQHAREEARIANLPPVAKLLGKVKSAPPPALPNRADEAKRAAVAPRSGDFVRVLPPQAKKQERRVFNPDAPDDQTLAERRLARTNKF